MRFLTAHLDICQMSCENFVGTNSGSSKSEGTKVDVNYSDWATFLLRSGYSFSLFGDNGSDRIGDWTHVRRCKKCLRRFETKSYDISCVLCPQSFEAPLFLVTSYLYSLFWVTVCNCDFTRYFCIFLAMFPIVYLFVIIFALCRQHFLCVDDTLEPHYTDCQYGPTRPTRQNRFNVSYDFVTREVILLSALRQSILSSKDKKGVIAAVVLYAQSHSQRSLIGQIYSLFKTPRNVSDDVEQMFEQSADSEDEWLQNLKDSLRDWKKVREHETSKNALKLINYVVSLGVCSASSLTFKMGSLTLFEPIVYKKQISASDITEVFLQTLVGFIEGGWKVMETGKVSDFFYRGESFEVFEKSYNKCRAAYGFSLTGNLRRYTEYDENSYEVLLESSIELGDKLLKKIDKASPDVRFIRERNDRLRDWLAEFTQIRSRGGMRCAPFAISLFGGTGVGKSTLNQLSIDAIGAYNGFSVTPERVANWGEDDRFASNIRSTTNVIVFDDFGNTTPQYMQFSPTFRLIQCVNNAVFIAPMAEAHLKGKVTLNPQLVMVTTNVRRLLADTYSEKPESILRRLYHVTVDIKPEFKSNGTLDTSKVVEKFGFIKCPDIWKLTVNKCVVGPPIAEGSNKNETHFVPLKFEGKEMVDVSVFEYLKWAQITSKDFYSKQKEMVEVMRKPADLTMCATCGLHRETCSCPPPPPEGVEQGIELVVDNTVQQRDPVVQELEALSDSVRSLGVDPNEELDEQSEERPRVASKMFRQWLIFWLAFGVTRFIAWLIARILADVRRHAAQQRQREYETRTTTTSGVFFFRTRTARGVFASIFIFFDRLWCNYIMMIPQLFEEWYVELRDRPVAELLRLRQFLDHWAFDWVVWIPDSWCSSPAVLGLLWMQQLCPFLRNKWAVVGTYLMILVCSLDFLIMGMYIKFLIIWMSVLVATGCILQLERRRVREELLNRRDTVPEIIKFLRNNYAKVFLGSLVGFFFLYKVYKLLKSLEPQGSLMPITVAEVAERDAETNPWARLFISPLPMSVKSKTITSEDLTRLCADNSVCVESEHLRTRGFFLKSNLMVIPTHFVNKCREREGVQDFFVRCYRRHPSVVGGNFRETIAKEYCYSLPGTDFTVVWAPSSGSMRDLTPFLPTNKVSSSEAVFVDKNKEAEIDYIKTFYTHSWSGVKHRLATFPGGHYNVPKGTEPGMCMSPLVSNGRGSLILGFHLCGKGILGGCGTLLARQAEEAYSYFDQKIASVSTTSMGDMPKEIYGTELVEHGEVHRKSATRFISEGCSIEVYGPTSGRATPESRVIPTIITDTVAQEFGVPQKWGPPKLKGKGVYPYQVGLEQLSHPSMSLGSVVETACKCYLRQFKLVKGAVGFLFEEAKPLTQVEVVSGIKGKRFIDAMNMDTSPGWPLTGRKDEWIVELPPTEEHDNPRTFVPEVWEEVARIRNTVLKGERAYPVWKAALKDEPTKLEKVVDGEVQENTKVRVFQCAPIGLQALLRQLFMPIVRIIQCHPILTECMVGVNAEGPEWEQISNFMESKGPNILAGDYSKYDQRMPAQLTTAAFGILIRVAEMCPNYTKEDIQVMKGIVNEVVYPVMAYNGDLIQLYGSNPSGQNLTVIVNSIVNSLLLRCCYYTIYPLDDPGEFSRHCAFATYGDDVKGSVSPARAGFNHISFAEYLKQYDIVFTMPDKESTPTHYMSTSEADFLKRKSVWNEDLECCVGVLDESSIFKRLHSHLTSKILTVEQQAAQNIDSSLHDWFYYGREVFDKRREQLKRVAKHHDIIHLCPGLERGYDERVARWNRKYRDKIEEEEEEVIEFELTYRLI